MDRVRLFLAYAAWFLLPPALVFWFVLHPLVTLWRKVGPGVTYAVLTVIMFATGFAMYLVRHLVPPTDLGFEPLYAVLGGAFLVGGYAIAWQRRKQLTKRILVGLPELAPQGAPSKLLVEGIYAHIRHPRYVEFTLILTGSCLIANYAAAYWILAATVVGLYLIVLLEERELVARFGDEYRRYAERVPRFLPRKRE